MSDTWTVYRALGAGADGQDIELDFGIKAQHSELNKFRSAGHEIHYRTYEVGRYNHRIYWRGPWKLDTPSERQKELIELAMIEAKGLKKTIEEKGYKRGYAFIRLKGGFGELIAGYVCREIFSEWSHKCPKLKYDNESRSLNIDKCPECGMERQKTKVNDAR